MAYSPTYTSTDVSPIIIDGLTQILIAVIGFASIIGLVFLYRFLKKK